MINRGDMLMTRLLKLRTVKKFLLVRPVTMAKISTSRTMALSDINFTGLKLLTLSIFLSMVFSPPYSNWVARAMMFS